MMEKSEFYNFETSCLCEVCSNCKMKNLSDFLNEHHLDLDDFNDFNNDFNNYNYFIEKDSRYVLFNDDDFDVDDLYSYLPIISY